MGHDFPDSDSDSASAEAVREFMDEKVKIEGGINPSREHELGSLLQNLPGVQSIVIAGDEISIHYEPTQITSKEMHERMRAAGFTPKDMATAPAVPPVNQ